MYFFMHDASHSKNKYLTSLRCLSKIRNYFANYKKIKFKIFVMIKHIITNK